MICNHKDSRNDVRFLLHDCWTDLNQMCGNGSVSASKGRLFMDSLLSTNEPSFSALYISASKKFALHFQTFFPQCCDVLFFCFFALCAFLCEWGFLIFAFSWNFIVFSIRMLPKSVVLLVQCPLWRVCFPWLYIYALRQGNLYWCSKYLLGSYVAHF